MAGETILVDGKNQPYVRNSTTGQARSPTAVRRAGSPVAVHGVIVWARAGVLTVKSQPQDVHVVDRVWLIRWLTDHRTCSVRR